MYLPTTMWRETHLFPCVSPPPPPPPVLLFPPSFPPLKVQWSHLAALKSSNSAAPSPPPPPPVVSRSQSFSESGSVTSSIAQLQLRSQDPHHHHHHPSPARTDPQPQPPHHHHPQAQTRVEHQSSIEEVPPKVRNWWGPNLCPWPFLSCSALSSHLSFKHCYVLTTVASLSTVFFLPFQYNLDVFCLTWQVWKMFFYQWLLLHTHTHLMAKTCFLMCPLQVPVRTTSRSPVLSRRESPLPSQTGNQGVQRIAGRLVKRCFSILSCANDFGLYLKTHTFKTACFKSYLGFGRCGLALIV